MFDIEIASPGGAMQVLRAPDDIVIGKGAHCELRLDGWRVAREHARLFQTPSGVLLDDMGAFSGVWVNGRRVESQYGPLDPADVITIGAHKLRLLDVDTDETAAEPNENGASHAAALANPSAPLPPYSTKAQPAARKGIEAHQAGTFAGGSAVRAAAPHTHATDQPLQQADSEWPRKVHAQLLDTMDLRRHDISGMSDERLRAETDALIAQIVEELDPQLPEGLDRALLRKQVLDEAIGLGPLEELLADETVTEIMVNRYDQIYVERGGRLLRHPLTFTGDRAVLGVIERIVAPLGRRIDDSSPMVDARLKDGSRVNAIIPPLALKGACLTIRKFSKRKLTGADLVQFGSVGQAMAAFLQICVVARKNVIVSGGTGSGKTTLLNILSNFIPAHERVITVEDAAELQLHHEHLISLESRPSNAEGKGAVLIRDLVRNTLRMRPDRIVIGECRGAEALDMLQAMNTGHEGSLTTLHANSPRDAIARLETMVLMAGMDLPLPAIREQICSAVDIIVQQARFACGTRVVTSITEVVGMEAGKIQLQEIFRFHNTGYGESNGRIAGTFTGCDLVPSFYEELRGRGQALEMEIFKTSPELERAREEDFAGSART